MTARRDPLLTTPDGRLEAAGLKAVFGYQLAQAGVVTDRVFELAVGRPMGLHRLEFTILMLLRDNPGCTAVRLAKALNVSTPNMALWLERVDKKGWIERIQSAADRRANHLRLTSGGEQVAGQALAAVQSAELSALSALTDGERAILGELLHKVAASRNAVPR